MEAVGTESVRTQQQKLVAKCLERLIKCRGDPERFKSQVNDVFDQLNALEFNIKFLEEKDVTELLNLSMDVLPQNNDHLLSKWCHLVTNLISRQQIVLQTGTLLHITQFIVRKVENSGVWALPDLLTVLSVLLQDNGASVEKFWEKFVGKDGMLLKFSAPNYPDMEINHISMKCMQNLLARKQNEVYLNEDLLLNCYSALLASLKAYVSCAVDDISNCKVIVTVLKALQNLLLGWKTIPIGQLGCLLGLLKFYLFHGQPGQGSLTSVCLYPSVGSQFASTVQQDNETSFPKLMSQKKRNRRRSKTGKGKNKKKEQQGEDDELSEGAASDSGYNSSRHSQSQINSTWNCHSTPPWLTSGSDSEYSDTEINQLARIRSAQSSVRQHAFVGLQAVVRVTDKKTMFGYWLSFLPDSPSASIPQPQTILLSILKDPSPQVRAAAISVLTDLLEGSKQFLMVADESVVVRTAFIPLSTTLGVLVRELHRCLLLALLAENSSFILIQLLKCYATLINNVPYHRFRSDLLIRLLKHLYPLLHHKDSQVQVACLSVLGSIVCVQPAPVDISTLLKSSVVGFESGREPLEPKTADVTPYSNVPWLIQHCQDNILKKDVPLPVQLESLQLLGLFMKVYFDVMRYHLPCIEEVITLCLEDTNSFLQLHGAKLLESTGVSMCNACQNTSNDSTQLSTNILQDVSQFWKKLLDGPLPKCLQNDNHNTLRSICCNCLSTVTANVFESFPKNTQIFCLTVMLGLARESDPNVKGAAIRCLGIYALFPCLREDASFLLDAGEIIVEAINDGHFGVRSKASWSLGNLSNALLLSKEEHLEFSLEVPDIFVYSLGMAAIVASKDRDNVPANAVRTLGNLLFYLSEDALRKEQIKSMILDAVSALLKNLKTRFVKVRWNSCYALGKVLQNSTLLEAGILPMDDIFVALLSTLSEGTNFKVCINAASSLSSISKREYYGRYLVNVWHQLVMSLSNSRDDIDFRELKHQTNLCNQLCKSLCHLTTLLQPEDLADVAEMTLLLKDSLLTSMNKFLIDPANDEIRQRAEKHLDKLSSLPAKSTAREVLYVLQKSLHVEDDLTAPS
ncbi:HEAT repeat-containing protein 6-like [Centruroides sculpturatus]|uniref:HEAT repeat-containing protein 6-like n=1 Tax=Centruroides sculpturatus TaxID=218467 RepID=UPI000C6CC491|nr:HEAT repeat-containing protein 6-like [Centruroides sculpturatus]